MLAESSFVATMGVAAVPLVIEVELMCSTPAAGKQNVQLLTLISISMTAAHIGQPKQLSMQIRYDMQPSAQLNLMFLT